MVNAPGIKLIASNAVKHAGRELLPAFERATGHAVSAGWGGTIDVTARVDGGEVVDVVILSAASIDGLIERGRLAAGSRVDVVRSGIGIATRPGAARPDTSSGAALASSLIRASSIVLSSGPSSVYLAELFRRMHIADAIKSKVRQLGPGLSVGEALAEGRGEVGLTQLSELLAVKGIELLGPLPPDIQHVTVFSTGLSATAPDPARALVRFLASPEAAPMIRRSGLEPA